MKVKRAAILQSSYLPWKGYFDLINSVDDFVLYDCVQYSKNDWRNRNKIATKNGPVWITIPVRVKSIDQLINETEVASTNWAKKHYRSIQQSYSKRPYFDAYEQKLVELFDMASEIKLLTDINFLFLKWMLEELDISTRIHNANDFELPDDRNERLVHICKSLQAECYLSGPAAKDYLKEDVFSDRGLKVEWMSYGPYKEYEQNGNIFEHAVSALDVLLNRGPDAIDFMRPL